ncbi:MAG: dienelactone hydrolase family protein [Alteromonadaceae bacterium]|nr:dienelactone hydrolase family protein [Alteromonadaceae bacterium]
MTKQGFQLKADYYKPQQAENKAVILLHQCNFNRTMHDDIGKELSSLGIHALSLDFRGFGESISEEFDRKKLSELPRNERRQAFGDIREYWPEDVQLAYDFLRNRVGDTGLIGVVGASCGGRQAKIVAENNPIDAISFFSSAMTNGDGAIEKYKEKFSKIPTLFISAEQDATYKFTQKGFALNENIKTKFISYKGKIHGHPLLTLDTRLGRTMAVWFDNILVK